MFKNKKYNIIFSIVCNLVIVVLTVISVASFFISGGKGNMEVTGAVCFRYFTIDSNIFLALSSIAVIVSEVKSLKNRSYTLGGFATTVKYIGTVAISVTFFTVIFFLGPVSGYLLMIEGVNLFMHIINPVLAVASFLLFEIGHIIPTKFAIFGVLPTFIYGCVYLYNVLISEIWPDFYNFNMGGKWYISVIAMLLGTYLIALCWQFIHKKASKASRGSAGTTL